ncbi:MAG: hypothetical protein H6981_00495 [Gammaproteobacteria bacterium]|nr:hypothetical protein [Gammaproteobacteria bacterium]MCP5135267.1 hypothetical protein [Gammaproteobacteria bacterium]
MENIELLERLNHQIERLIGELSEARAENARLSEELLDCRSESDARAAALANHEETLSLQAVEIEDMLERISGALNHEAAARANDAQMDLVETSTEN